jgi:hypothetical protein
MHKITIVLQDLRNTQEGGFRVKSATNTITYRVGEKLTEEQVTELLSKTEATIRIVA